MIHLSDAAVIAVTKLRTHKVRTAITIVVSGLLFGALVAVLFVYQGTSDSLGNFNSSGLGSRYLVLAHLNPSSVTPYWENETIQSSAKKIYQETLAEKKAEAKKLGLTLPLTPDPLDQPVTLAPGGGSQMLNPSAPAAQEAVYEYQQKHPGPDLPELTKLAAPYHPIGFYSANLSTNQESKLHYMPGGREDFSLQDSPGTSGTDMPSIDFFAANLPVIMSPQLTKPFLFQNVTNTTQHPDAIPLVVSYGIAAQILGVDRVSSDAPAKQSLAQIEKLYQKSKNAAFAVCYRNDVSQQQISDAIQYNAHKGDKGYEKPNIIYGLPPASSCERAAVISDNRTPAQKAVDEKQMKFDEIFGSTIKPVQYKIWFRIVGLTPNSNMGNSGTMSALLQSLAGSSLMQSMVIPQDMFQALPNYKVYKTIFETPAHPTPAEVPLFGSRLGYYVEFASAENARNFLQNESCTSQMANACTKIHKPFMISTFGSNSLGIESLLSTFRSFFKLALAVVAATAIIILGGTVGRMLADGRRESAVFRAIGARRVDIALIYMTYTFFLSVIVAAFALVVGFVSAYILDYLYSGAATVQAKLAFGAVNTDKVFDLFTYTPYIWIIVAVAVVAGLASAIFPLFRNGRRNPINDLRDE